MPDAATAAAAPNPHLAQYAAKGLKGRILSGVQPTGNLHLGNYLGAIRNFARLQNDYECLYCVVDMHAITVWQDPKQLASQTREIASAFLAAGVDGNKHIIFNQSMVPAHAQLAWIFNCVARMGWMSRMTQFKEKAGKDRENVSLGLFAYPALMAADILVYRATHVPVGEDQASHVELTREAARRFNHLYGREPDFEERVQASLAKLPKDSVKRFEKSRKQFQETGDAKALEGAMGYIASSPELDSQDRERLSGYFKGTGKTVLPEP